MKKSSKSSAAPVGTSDPKSAIVVATGTLSEDAQMGQQVTVQYHRAIGAVRDILIFGAMLLQVEQHLERNLISRGKLNSPGRPGGTGLKGWLEEHAPEVKYNTAYKYKRLAEALHQSLQLPKKADFVHLIAAPIEELSDTEKTKREKLDLCIQDKSQRQLLFDFGIDTKAGKENNGSTPGRKVNRRTDDEIERDQFEATAPALCLTALTKIEKVLTCKGPKEEAAVWLLDDEALEKLKLAALDLHTLCTEAQARRKGAKS